MVKVGDVVIFKKANDPEANEDNRYITIGEKYVVVKLLPSMGDTPILQVVDDFGGVWYLDPGEYDLTDDQI